MTVTRKIKCAGVTSARRAGLTIYGSLCFGTLRAQLGKTHTELQAHRAKGTSTVTPSFYMYCSF